MIRYHALGGASFAVLGSTLSLMPSAAVAQTSLPAVTVEAPRGTAARPAARKPAVRSSARTQARPPSATARAIGVADRGHYAQRGARAAQYGAQRADRNHHRSQPIRESAGILRRRHLAREPGRLDQAGQRPARHGHLDSRFQRPQRVCDSQPRDFRRRLSGHPARRAFPQRPDRSKGLWRDRCHPRTVVGALWQLCHRWRAELPHPSGSHHRRGRIRRRGRQLRLSQQLSRRWQEDRQFRILAVYQRCAR